MTDQGNSTIRMGARGSMLSRMQSQWVADRLESLHAGLKVEVCIFKTSGDQIADRPLHEFGGKGLFTKELELALLDGQIDFAVHSFKDVPVTMPLVEQGDLITPAVPKREDPRDALISLVEARRIADLPRGAKVGTGSLRRQAQVLALRPDLLVANIRGNVDTRLRKLHEGEFEAVILAMAGLRRSGLFDKSLMCPVEIDEILPAAGQGALSLQCRRADRRTSELLMALNDEPTAVCVRLERQIVQRLNGDCHSPIAALATIEGDQVLLRAAVGGRDGRPPVIRAAARTPVNQGDTAVSQVTQSLIEQGVFQLLGQS